MAVDTAQKRFSMLNFGDGTTVHMLFQADATVDADDMYLLLDIYSGITLAPPVPAVDLVVYTVDNVVLQATLQDDVTIEGTVTDNVGVGSKDAVELPQEV